MKENIIISAFEKGQEREVYKLIRKVYDEFVSKDYTDEGNRFFYNWIKPSNIAKRQKNNRSILVAKVGDIIVGMIEIRDSNRISLLFVDRGYHGQGIARKLCTESLKNCLIANPKLLKFYVHASPYSIPIYRKLGFVETDVMQEKIGIKYLPMEMKIK
jgi:GNAT superfamily N-acetyltransferase